MQIYIATILILIISDAIWLGFLAKTFYQKYLGYIFAGEFAMWPAVIFYALYAFGIVYFVLTPALEAKSLSLAITRGALLGLLAYGAYDLTNQATIMNWPIVVTFVDMAWGVALTSLASSIVYIIFSK